ncbi:MAG: TolC family protein, partial [Planctomycetota bacterium]
MLGGCAVARDPRQDEIFEVDRGRHVAEVSSETETQLATEPTLELVETLAVSRNPDVLVALERWAQHLERAPQKWAAPNPFVGYSYASMFKMHELGSGLTIPFPSKLAAEANAALAEARAAGADYRESETRIRAEAARAYASLWLAQRQLGIVDENLVLLARFIEIAEAKLKAGTASLADTLRAQVERDGLRAERASLAREVDIARSALNVLLDRAPDAPLGPLGPLPDPLVRATGGPLVEEALGRRPALVAE